MKAQAPFPQQTKLYLPDGGFLTATRWRGEEDDDTMAIYEIQCVGQESVLRAFVNTMPQGEKRTILLRILALEAENPTCSLHAAMHDRDMRPDSGYDLRDNEATAIIIQSRALGRHGRVMDEKNNCEECTTNFCGLGMTFPFTKCAGISSYNSVAITCANCIWKDCVCDLVA